MEGSEDILFTLNKDSNFAFKKVNCLGGSLSSANNALAVNFFGGDDPCAGAAFFALEGEGTDLCVQVPNCDAVGGDNCFESLGECEASSFVAPSFYCVTGDVSTGACCASAIGGGWGCANTFPPAFPNTFESCMEQDFSGSRHVFFPGQDCSYCDTLPVQLNLPPVGEQVPPASPVSKILVEDYDPSIHTIVSGPVSASESCFSSSSSESSESFVSSSSSSFSVDGGDGGGDGGDGGGDGGDGGTGSSSTVEGDGGDGGGDGGTGSSSTVEGDGGDGGGDGGDGGTGSSSTVEGDGGDGGVPGSSSSSVDGVSSSSSSSVDGGDGGGDGGVPGSSSSSVDGVSSSSSSSTVEGDGGDGGDGGTGSSTCSEGLPVSVAGVLDSFPDLPGVYYGEDESRQIVVAAFDSFEFMFEDLGVEASLPVSSNVFVDGEVVGTMFFLPNYIGSRVALVWRGEIYCGFVEEYSMYFWDEFGSSSSSSV